YAPGREEWIAGKRFVSRALYSPMRGDRFAAWQGRRLYYECSLCHYALTVPLDQGNRGEHRDCDACGGSGTLGPARYWIRPPGFAHPIGDEEAISPDDQPVHSYATRAKLAAPTPVEDSAWRPVCDRIRSHHMRQHLLVTNRGPRDDGYTYCL